MVFYLSVLLAVRWMVSYLPDCLISCKVDGLLPVCLVSCKVDGLLLICLSC